ncbi:hypothetical protein RZO07_24780 [Pseudomonas protegens]|uniref:hypothetical protein n=1 Tax=Pseudomonas TaxID=286 RepID=UPI001356DE0D|nr:MULTISPECIES: hypothetical protein [Pseudomonas]KAF0864930.1 hypothetical protein PLD_06450 [Pseudomonas sp. LD120]MCO7572117.1 hypothetical protein [Pseudomonas chlororaphis]MCO7590033.1 hypothetical protein [Pseudomonas chlororaphis]WOE78478.1 hypothetical protein RZO07_24780 [Pseudomonas protegens]
MNTDWQQIRDMMNTVIDSCEQIEAAGYREEYRSAKVQIEEQDYSVHEFLISAWTLPENLRYRIIQERHDQGASVPYVPESARALVAMAQACAELIGAADTAPAKQAISGMQHWYTHYAVPHIKTAIEQAKKAEA